MSFSNTTETNILAYVANATVPSWAGNANFWFAAHFADPGEAGTAITSEQTYGSYARIPVVRATGLAVAGNAMSNVNLIQFPISTTLGPDITHLSLVTTASGAGQIIGRYVMASPIPTAVNVQPLFPPSSLVYTLD
jgi:hypothetical protein